MNSPEHQTLNTLLIIIMTVSFLTALNVLNKKFEAHVEQLKQEKISGWGNE